MLAIFSTALSQAKLRRIAARPVVVLSPHFDDGSFSLGGLLAALGHGTLITVFSRGRHLARRMMPTPPPTSDDVGRIRRDEDQAFAARCGLTRRELGCEEPALRGRTSRELQYLDDDIDQIAAPVQAALADAAASFPPQTRGVLFAPLGVGWHCNHRAIAELVLRRRHDIGAHYEIFFYEELPYASHWRYRRDALRRHRAVLHQRYHYSLPWAEKQSLVEQYPSQFDKPPRRKRFRPMAPWPFALHEAFWDLLT
jgi:LmbE family N-acetylglucosaminyl deacetylase